MEQVASGWLKFGKILEKKQTTQQNQTDAWESVSKKNTEIFQAMTFSKWSPWD